jgi:pullulanase/glycogen debranching enzyme
MTNLETVDAAASGSVEPLAAPEAIDGHGKPWWRDAVVYQVYVRSFADANGDGIGDLAGVRANLAHLAELGVDALWFSPWYPSPMADSGYDIADYRAIEPDFGTLEEAEQLIAEARALGIRTIVDIVPNHVSSEHPWFRARAFGFGRGEVTPESCRRTTGSRSSAGRRGRGRRTTASGTSTCSRPSSPT